MTAEEHDREDQVIEGTYYGMTGVAHPISWDTYTNPEGRSSTNADIANDQIAEIFTHLMSENDIPVAWIGAWHGDSYGGQPIIVVLGAEKNLSFVTASPEELHPYCYMRPAN